MLRRNRDSWSVRLLISVGLHALSRGTSHCIQYTLAYCDGGSKIVFLTTPAGAGKLYPLDHVIRLVSVPYEPNGWLTTNYPYKSTNNYLYAENLHGFTLLSANVNWTLIINKPIIVLTKSSSGRRFQTAVKFLGGYVLLAWVGNQFAFFLLTCKPFSGNWATTPPSGRSEAA